MTRALLLAFAFAASACGGGGDDDGTPFVDSADEADAAAPPDSLSADCTCGPSQGCLALIVGREADDSMMPWVLFPTESDGTGTLIAGASDGPTVLARRTLEGVDLVSVPARTNTIHLGCLPDGPVTLGVFLDDNLNAEVDAIGSADYRDTCLLDRNPTATVVGDQTTFVPLSLFRTCD